METLLQRAVKEAGSQRKAALKLGIGESWFSKVKKQPKQGFGVQPCFQLAVLIGELPQVALRACGHVEVADALDEYYGPTRTRAASPPEDPLVLGVRAMLASPTGEKDRDFLERLLAPYIGAEVDRTTSGRKRGGRR